MPILRLASVVLALGSTIASAQLFQPADGHEGGSLTSKLPSPGVSVLEPLGSLFQPQERGARSVEIPLRDKQQLAEDGARKSLAQLMASGRIAPNSHVGFTVSPDGRVTWSMDKTCFAIRSYLMARDDKDTDSTHLVRTSTCIPSNKYELRTADVRATPDAH